MKKFAIFAQAAVLLSATLSHAAIVENKYQLKSRYYNEFGEVTHLFDTRLYIKLNDSVGMQDPLARQDCLVTVGGKGLFQLSHGAGPESCVSDREYVIVDETLILKLMERAASLTVYGTEAAIAVDSMSMRVAQRASDVKLENQSIRDRSALSRVVGTVRNLFSPSARTQMVATRQRTVFALQSEDGRKFTLEIEPVSQEIITH